MFGQGGLEVAAELSAGAGDEDALRYLFDAALVLPNWLTVLLAGLLLLAAGMAILLGREQWTRWQQDVEAWWKGEPLPSRAE